MEKLEFYQRLKESIESDDFKEELICINERSYKHARLFLEKALYFLISTHDFNNFEYFINHRSSEKLPYRYLEEVKGLTKEEIKKELYKNFIRDGFLFHITRKSNVSQILNTGLLTLNDKYKCDVYQSCLDLDLVYQRIKERNKDNSNHIFTLPSLINVPGGYGFTKERFNTIYLSSDLGYILDTYGEVGEFSSLLVDDIFCAFTGYYEPLEDDKEKKISKIFDAILKNDIQITEEELFYILDFIKRFSEEKKESSTEKSILMIDNNSLKNPSPVFEMLYRKNNLNLTVETIIQHNEGEIEHQGSIESQDIIALIPEDDNTYKVRIKSM